MNSEWTISRPGSKYLSVELRPLGLFAHGEGNNQKIYVRNAIFYCYNSMFEEYPDMDNDGIFVL